MAFRGPYDRSGDRIDFRSMVSVQILKHARPVCRRPLRDEERAVSQLFLIHVRTFGLRDCSRLVAHRLEDCEKALVPNDPPVGNFREGCDRVDGCVHDKLGPQLRANVARHARDDSHVREEIPQADEIRFVDASPGA